jgi:hypothetical protein
MWLKEFYLAGNKYFQLILFSPGLKSIGHGNPDNNLESSCILCVIFTDHQDTEFTSTDPESMEYIWAIMYLSWIVWLFYNAVLIMDDK